VTGESGTGKELVARTVHDLSRRRGRPFLAVNCGAISPHLMESEIFGHEKGSFTGADRQHLGFFERANGGTLFLDELTEMPLDLQVKLLRVLETGTFMRVGATQTRRPTCASSPPPTATRRRPVADGRLREDLFYRLNVFPIHIAAAARARRRHRPPGQPFHGRHLAPRRPPEALQQPAAWSAWPAPLARQCARAAQHRAARLCDGPQRTVSTNACRSAPSRGPPWRRRAMPSLTLPRGHTAGRGAERQHMTLSTLEYFGRHKERTAAALGVSLKTLYNRLKEYARLVSTCRQRPRRQGPLSRR
jgi:two-component system response regulator AtoC